MAVPHGVRNESTRPVAAYRAGSYMAVPHGVRNESTRPVAAYRAGTWLYHILWGLVNLQKWVWLLSVWPYHFQTACYSPEHWSEK